MIPQVLKFCLQTSTTKGKMANILLNVAKSDVKMAPVVANNQPLYLICSTYCLQLHYCCVYFAKMSPL